MKKTANTTTVATNRATVTTSTVSPRRTKRSSQRQQKRAEMLAAIRLSYYGLSPQARNGFQTLCRQMPGNQIITATGMKQKVTTFFLFSMLNQAARYSGAADAVTEPASRPETPQPIPADVQLVSQYNIHNQWSLRLTGAAYEPAVSIGFAPPAMAASPYPANSYLQGAPLPDGIPQNGVDLTAEFLSIYPAPPLAGEKVGVQLMGVLPSGFASARVTVHTVTTSLLANAQQDGDDTLRVA